MKVDSENMENLLMAGYNGCSLSAQLNTFFFLSSQEVWPVITTGTPILGSMASLPSEWLR